MSESDKVVLADGLLAILLQEWEYSAESDDGSLTYAVCMRNSTCNANLELLNCGLQSPKQFISDYRFSLMEGLVDIGAIIQAVDSKHPDELVAVKEGLKGSIFHTFIPSNPVVHISAIYQSKNDLIDLRLIKESIEVDESFFNDTSEEIIAMKVSDQWNRSEERN